MSEAEWISFIQRLTVLVRRNEPILSDGQCINPWPTWDDPDLFMQLCQMFMKSDADIPSDEEKISKAEWNRLIQWSRLQNKSVVPDGRCRYPWHIRDDAELITKFSQVFMEGIADIPSDEEKISTAEWNRLIQWGLLKDKPVVSDGRYRYPWRIWNVLRSLTLLIHMFMNSVADIPSDEEEISKAEWNRLIQWIHLQSKPIVSYGRYRNPWPTWDDPNLFTLFRQMFMKSNADIPSDEEELARTLPVLRPDLTQFSTSPAEGVRFMWIGQSSSLVQFDGFTLLTDPIFSDRCSPKQWIGPRRYRPPPCTIDELPRIDCVLISHDHYDNLDYSTVLALNERYGRALRWYVPMGLKSWMESSGCRNVVELTWWNQYVHSKESNIKIVCTPCQHWCKRGIFDTNKVLWTSWCVIGPKNRFFFVGDTGYCPVFEEIGLCYGPFTLSALPIGAYEPRCFFSSQHVHPWEAVQIHIDVRSETSIGIDWGTFALASKEFYLDPRNKLQEAVEDRGMNPQCFITVKHGEIIVVKSQHHTSISDSS